MPDTNISRRQDMGKEAAYKFHGRQLDLLICSGALVIPDTKAKDGFSSTVISIHENL